MVSEEFFPDPFVEGGWFLFHTRDRLFSWQAVRITARGQELAVRHSSRLKALLWIEKEIQRSFERKLSGPSAMDTLKGANQIILQRLTYDWAPLNAALEASK